ncbi:MAG: hypothetical protein JOY80_10510, partial [Candidatus Dormibacteraeota bacterium]|nr:hypothetical protein [Candidatus Dormibacteraeota bacterium]
SSWEASATAPKAPAKMVPPPPKPAAEKRQRPTYTPATTRAPPPTRRPDDLDTRQGRWVSSALFVLMLLFALALAGYTFARPFLPAEWIPF